MLELLIYVAIGGVILWFIFWLMGYLHAPEAIRVVVIVVAALIFLLYVVQNLGVMF